MHHVVTSFEEGHVKSLTPISKTVQSVDRYRHRGAYGQNCWQEVETLVQAAVWPNG